MNTLSSAYGSAISGLNAASARLAVSANNVANANTDGFEPSTVDASNAATGGVRISISPQAREKYAGLTGAAKPDTSGVDLAQEVVSQDVATTSYRANLRTLATAQQLDETLMSLR